MRIVIDLQTAQVALSKGRKSIFLQLAHQLVSETDAHEFFLILSDRWHHEGDVIRKAFARALPPDSIRTWFSPALNGSDDGWKRIAAKYLRNGLIAGFKPDVVVIGGMDQAQELETLLSHSALSKDLPTIMFADNPSDIHEYEAVPGMTEMPLAPSSLKYANAADRTRVEISRVTVVSDLRGFFAVLERLDTGKWQGEVPSDRRRLAYFSPLPPERTGIGDYSTELLPALSRYYEIDVIVNQPEVSSTPAMDSCNTKSVEWFLDNVNEYDRVIYHIGNSPFHLHMFDCLDVVPGVVVQHDFFLSGALEYQEFQLGVPYSWGKELYVSHGYRPLIERFKKARVSDVAIQYPSNFSIFQRASGIVVHSNYSRQLADTWYGEGFSKDWVCIPHLRVPDIASNRDDARRRLGLDIDDFVVCSFGILANTKQSRRLFDTWCLSDLLEQQHCKLVFVGANGDDEYGRGLVNAIRDWGLEDRVKITGWASREAFQDYLAAADIAVQLRTFSRGETSGTVLDCMNHGVPTIVNACGSMADLPEDAVWMLPEEFTDSQLIDAMEALWRNRDRRIELGRKAREVILTRHDPATCARLYSLAIEKFYLDSGYDRPCLIKTLASSVELPVREEDLASLASAMAKSLPMLRPAKQLFLDVSVTSRTDLKTGIERVTRALLNEFINSPPEGYRVEPVYLSEENGQWHYRYARQYTLDAFGCPNEMLVDELIEPQAGDILFCADLAGDMTVRAEADGVYRELKNVGVTISFMVHDLLPATMPEVFPPEADKGFNAWVNSVVRISDVVVCVSKSVAEELRDRLAREVYGKQERLRLCWSHHGADIQATVPSQGLPRKATDTLMALKERASFLMVGTIEPRKGHLQAVEAFNLLWQAGIDINLVIVGKEGWQGLPDEQRRTIPLLKQMLANHPERGRRLFWLEEISDEYLDRVYAACDCLLAASLGEGFGLPLIEAATHNIPILARDIPIFREVAGNHASYFSGENAESLSTAIRQWIAGSSAGETAGGNAIPFLTWNQSAANLATRFIPHNNVVVSYGENRHTGELALLSRQERRLYVDVSVVSITDFKTGIQRAVRALLSQFVDCPPQEFSIYPVRLVERDGTWIYEIAENYYEEYCLSNLVEGIVPKGEIDPQPGDILLGLDLAGGYVVPATRQGVYERFRQHGMKFYFVVYDLLPVTVPKFFPEPDSEGHEAWLKSISLSDGILCISRAVADEYRAWFQRHVGDARNMPKVGWFHLGSDIANSNPSRGMPEDAGEVLAQLAQRPTFLTVGTVEPRKGYGQVLDAFRRIWAEGGDANLVIVGKKGWNVDSLIEELRREPEFGRRLYWLESISDEYLEAVYAASTCLVSASEGEGFGLPLIEAARHGLPLVLRDIPVFREVAGKHAFYFNGGGQEIAEALREWLELHVAGKAPDSARLSGLTWRESADQLIKVVLEWCSNTESKKTEGNEGI